jgi:hypothetical protein
MVIDLVECRGGCGTYVWGGRDDICDECAKKPEFKDREMKLWMCFCQAIDKIHFGLVVAGTEDDARTYYRTKNNIKDFEGHCGTEVEVNVYEIPDVDGYKVELSK